MNCLTVELSFFKSFIRFIDINMYACMCSTEFSAKSSLLHLNFFFYITQNYAPPGCCCSRNLWFWMHNSQLMFIYKWITKRRAGSFQDSGKLQTLDILLKRLRAGNHRVLLFAQMTKMLNILEVRLFILLDYCHLFALACGLPLHYEHH